MEELKQIAEPIAKETVLSLSAAVLKQVIEIEETLGISDLKEEKTPAQGKIGDHMNFLDDMTMRLVRIRENLSLLG